MHGSERGVVVAFPPPLTYPMRPIEPRKARDERSAGAFIEGVQARIQDDRGGEERHQRARH
jgi:hypothetical protein